MSVQPNQSSSDPSGPDQAADGKERRFSTLIGSLAAATSSDREAPLTRPTFTARTTAPADAPPSEPADAGSAEPTHTTASEPADTDAAEPADTVPPGRADPTGPADTASPDVADAADAAAPAAAGSPAAAAGAATSAQPETRPLATSAPPAPEREETRALPRPAPPAMDEPLLSDAAGMRVRWQRVQASFVDNPQEAVGDAADLIEQTAQALVGALRQRQRQLRVMWERGPDQPSADGGGAARSPDTEHLRLLMQRYRALFNELCRP
jgi:hypothetical protein